jgi:hypothetical protein
VDLQGTRPRIPNPQASHLESKLTTLSKDGLLLVRRALMATGGATGRPITASPSNGASPPIKYWPWSSASAKRHRTLYAANFRFT